MGDPLGEGERPGEPSGRLKDPLPRVPSMSSALAVTEAAILAAWAISSASRSACASASTASALAAAEKVESRIARKMLSVM